MYISGEGNGTPLQYSCLENPMDGGAWWAVVHGVAKSQTRLSDFTFTFHFHASEKEMASHSSVLAWRIPGMGEPGGLLSMGSHRVGHDWSDLAAAAAYIYITSSLSLPPAHPHPIFVGHHRAAGWAPCITQQLLTSYLFHIWSSMYVDVTFSIHPTLSFPHCVHKSILYICITVPSLHIGSLIPFF